MSELTTDEMIRLGNDAILNRPPSIDTPEAAAYYKQVLEEIRPAIESGLTPHMPFEL